MFLYILYDKSFLLSGLKKGKETQKIKFSDPPKTIKVFEVLGKKQ